MKALIQNLLKLQEFEFDDPVESHEEAEIDELRRQIPAPILAHYDRLAKQGKKGVALVRHQVCVGCHMRLPLATVLALLQDTDIRTCDHCGRYLCLAPDGQNEILEAIEAEKSAGIKISPKHRAMVHSHSELHR
jgi:predicted  nucleic acid-binding Zn-ribbon protein